MKKDLFCDYILKYQTDLFRYAKSIVGNQADGEDAVSETILKAYEKIDQLRSKRKFKPWIFKILTNECYAILRKRRKMHLTDNGEVPEQKCYDTIEEGDILKLIHQMKPQYRDVLILYYYSEFSVKEIASILEIPQGTVKSRLSRGRNQLKYIYEKEGYRYEL
ncbi:MAG: sigma-70 family RNA polymerase sigma factor [Lachnospiraceae bacterium]|nr:sigma-70 family RNA polymerase sigma factor [Lachnospiraceae bacterium]